MEIGFLDGGVVLAEIERGVAEVWEVLPQLLWVLFVIEEAAELRGHRPFSRPLVKDKGQNGWKGQTVLISPGFPYFHHVAEETQRHGLVYRGLMLKEQVEKGRAAAEIDRKGQIRMGLMEVGFDK